MDLAEYALQMNPSERQALMAQILRARQRTEGEDQLAAANKRGHGLDLTAAAAMMGNNEPMALAAQYAAKQRQAQAKPVQMGQQGFMLPDQGSFVESPMFADEKAAGRDQQKDLARMRQDQVIEQARARRDQAESAGVLRQTLAQQAEEGRNERAAEGRALRLTLQGMRPDPRAAAEDKAAAKKAGDADKAITKFSASMEKAGIPEFEQALTVVEQNLTKYKDGKLPGYGRLEGYVPNALATNDQQGVRADMAQAANILLKSRSGAAVTDSEMRRFLQEVATGGGMDEQTLRRGWANVRRTFEAKKKNMFASVPGDTLGEYNERAGTSYQQGGAKPASAPMDDDALINKWLKK